MITMSIDYNQYLLFDFQVYPHSLTANNYCVTRLLLCLLYIFKMLDMQLQKKKTNYVYQTVIISCQIIMYSCSC